MKQRDGRSKSRPGVDEQRRLILEGAAELFAVSGSRGVSIAQICEHVEVSRPTFYRCFADKEALVEQLYQQAVRGPVELNMLSLLRRGQMGGTREGLEKLADEIFANAKLAQLVFVESADPSSPAYAIVQRSFDDAAKEVEAWYCERGLTAPSRTLLKATMVAAQWIVHDAITRGLSPKNKRDAKAALWELTSRVFRD
ncbi:MAG: TetR/AcrR family transcriptional regulator [Polyangiaceae bacterium]|nr:TetR/AcrR family transcriptional regulator [Polyangiaceae bacterium]